jgi:hypothetical protein
MPSARIDNVRFQDIGLTYITEAEGRARRFNPRVYYTYSYSDILRASRSVAVAVNVVLTATDDISLNVRRLRIIGCFLNVPWNASYAQTVLDVATAVGTL